MTWFLDSLTEFTIWLFFTSLKTTVIVAIVLMIQRIFYKKISAKWQHAVWFLVIARLIIPIEIPSPFSIFNVTKNMSITTPLESFTYKKTTEVVRSSAVTNSKNEIPYGYPALIKADVQIIESAKVSAGEIASILWILVAMGLGLVLVFSNFKIQIAIRNAKRIQQQNIQEILKRCLNRLHLKINVELVSLDGITSPYWYGMFKRRIVFPESLLKTLSDEKIEHIIMHELVHYKQKDVLLALLTSVLQILHWFNPVIWFAFLKMRADRETVCDEIVLTNIGEQKNKQYGRTIISLIEQASQQRMLSAAMGLADTKFYLKRRLKMIATFTQKSIWWTAAAASLLIVISVFALTEAKNDATISGNVSFQDGKTPKSINIGVHRLMPHDLVVINYVGKPIQLSTQSESEYHFKVKPGTYTIAAWAFGYERAFAEIIVPDEKTRIKIDFSLSPQSLPGPVTEVKVIGQFCDWKMSKAIPINRKGDKWYLDETSRIIKGSSYKFAVTGNKTDHNINQEKTVYTNMMRYYPGNNNVKKINAYATFQHIYDGGEIIFDPSKYVYSDGKAKIKVKGFDLYHQFAAIQDSLRVFEIYYHEVKENHKGAPNEKRRNAHAALKSRFENLEKQFDPFFAPIFHEYWLSNLFHFHPSFVDLWQLYQDGIEPDTATVLKFLEKSDFVDYFKSIIYRLEDIDPNNVITKGYFETSLQGIILFSNSIPTLRERLEIDKDYEFKYTTKFCKKTTNNRTKQELLFQMANHYASKKPYDFQKAKYLINWLYKDIPNSWYIKDGAAERVLNRAILKEGDPAPDFSVTSLKGETFHLEKLKGRFVFLEFWGSNCGPCRAETPNMIYLSESVSPDSLLLIGLAHADKKKALKYIQDKTLPYPNVIVSESMLNDYGVTYYPATFLIDPDGNICGKDMRGKSLVANVRKKMQAYAVN
jgi:beta-lactamase regulating signal transducer with metallopeptidase domain/peroxiredoxin